MDVCQESDVRESLALKSKCCKIMVIERESEKGHGVL